MAFLRSGAFYIVAAAVVLLSAAVYCLSGGSSDSRAAAEGRELRSRKVLADKAAKRDARAARLRDRKRDRKDAVAVKPEPVKPDFIADVGEEMKLTAEMKQMFLDLQAALDMENAKRVYALVHRLQLMDEWPDGIPRSVKLKALSALAWFGASGMAEAVGFLADSDPEIQQTALEKFGEMFSDWDLGDTGISEIIKQVVKVVHDKDALDTFYMELNNMRGTVKAETAIAIYDSGNPDAVSVLEDGMEFYFDSEEHGGLKGRALVERSLADAEQAYVDDPEKRAEDELFYGPFKK